MLFRKNIEPFCAYCKNSKSLDNDYFLCKKHGVVLSTYRCGKFSYDPLKRTPAPPAIMLKGYKSEDFVI